MKSLYVAAASLILGSLTIGGTAFAAPSPSAPKIAAKANQETKYCMAYDKVVGSRVTKTECKTKSEWARERVDIDRYLRS